MEYGLPMTRILRSKYSMPNLTRPGSSGTRGALVCKGCKARIASRKGILSWAFRGNNGKAALFATATNISFNPPSLLLMDTGLHSVQEFTCTNCSIYLGWKIIRAYEWPEKWKEGSCVLELDLLIEDKDVSEYNEDDTPTMTERELNSEKELMDNANSQRGTSMYLSVPTPELGHRRSSSELSSIRQRPLGPRVHQLQRAGDF